jgi:hypothetical protein
MKQKLDYTCYASIQHFRLAGEFQEEEEDEEDGKDNYI